MYVMTEDCTAPVNSGYSVHSDDSLNQDCAIKYNLKLKGGIPMTKRKRRNLQSRVVYADLSHDRV